ncbi:hypothetical protein BDN67DRAFT_992671 [Paxillus ammoniavirescens]|nr:hypothetical protein BDN67DRAFT_992671 [Paxillus ammoniavirescens]
MPSSQNRNEKEPLLPASIDLCLSQKSRFCSCLLTCLIKPIASQGILPYINLVPNITVGDRRKVGYYAGLIQSIFFVTQALTVLQWSRVLGRVGRKPVLPWGTLGLCLSMLCFVLSRTFLSLVLSRCATGALNGNVGVMKCFAFLPLSCQPVIGGFLSRPQDHFPRLFAGSFWGDYSYFLPCLMVAMLTTLIFMTILLFLNEALLAVVDEEATLCSGQYGAINKVYPGLPGSHGPHGPVPLKSLFIPKMSCSGVVNGIIQGFFAPLVLNFRAKILFGMGSGAYALTLGSGVVWSVWAFLACRLFFAVVQRMSFSCVLMYISASAPNQKSLGAVNGLSQTTTSAVRAIGPAMATSMFAYSVQHNLLGGHAVYLVLAAITLATSHFGAMLPADPGT